MPPVPFTTLLLLELVIVTGTGAGLTVNVKFCVATGDTPLAVIVKVYEPTGTVGGMFIRPDAGSILTPEGKPAPVNEYVIGGVPVAVTWNVPPVPDTMVVLLALVMSGATDRAVTVSVKLCVALRNPAFAVIVNVDVPVDTVLAIVITPVAGSIVTFAGAPDSVYVIGVVPVAVTWNVPTVPDVTFVLFALVNTTGDSVAETCGPMALY